MGRRGYPPEFRRKVLDLVEAGRTVADVARDLEIGGQTIYTWQRQERIDRGREPGLTSGERAELTARNAVSPSWRPSCRRLTGPSSWFERCCPQRGFEAVKVMADMPG
jgi:transposase-like protein